MPSSVPPLTVLAAPSRSIIPMRHKGSKVVSKICHFDTRRWRCYTGADSVSERRGTRLRGSASYRSTGGAHGTAAVAAGVRRNGRPPSAARAGPWGAAQRRRAT